MTDNTQILGRNFPLGEQSSILTTGTKAVKYFPENMNLKEAYVTLMTAPTVTAVTVDILKNGVSILTDKMTIAVGQVSSRGTELINDTTIYESDQIAFVVLTTDVSASILDCNLKYTPLDTKEVSDRPTNPSSYSDIYSSSRNSSEAARLKTYQTLTSVTNATAMNVALGLNAKITLTENTTITLSNLASGDEGNIVITQAAGNYTVAISPTPYVIDDGAGAIVITDGVGSITVLSYSYDGARLLINYGANYTNS